MQKRKLNWWWFFLTAGIIIPLCYYGFVKKEPPSFSFSYHAIITGLNPVAIYAVPVIMMLAVTLIFKLIPRLITPIDAQKVFCIIIGLLVLVSFYFSFANILQPDKTPLGNSRRYIDTTTFVHFESRTKQQFFPLLYFSVLFITFIFFFIVNFPRHLPETKNPLNDF